MTICRQMGMVNEKTNQKDVEKLVARAPATDPFADFHAAENTEMNADVQMALLSRLGPVVRERGNLMPKEVFYNLMRMITLSKSHY
ncbi:hypothetical protein TNIN_420571 [Trichonephila inaurata madagascariensis]|uniref:Uncharacterized protein n=1 Tax=Trichonephila inaurata madagascariensis TaxID=2747483 RepID=A0A8X7CLS3_9ARAC|nr:hypothetical protein TNIN_420571 [Trichonephila inaurata madagascariensis]